MQEPIPLSAPDITAAEVRSVAAALRSGRLSMGPNLEAFESAIARRAGRKYAVGVNSGTSGLHLCVRALGIGPGDEVITTPFTFVATTNCLLFEGVRPVLADIDPNSYNLNPSAVAAAITPKTRAILPVEVFGNMAHFPAYEQIARRHGLMLIEDCCEALGGRLDGRDAGSFGECGVFAFYPNKQITTGEGGMIVTDREDLRDLCVSMRNQGRDSDNWHSYARLGYNYRLSELHAALGRVQADRLDEILQKRRCSAEMYNHALADIEEVHLPPMADREGASWFVYVIRLADRFAPADRDAVISHMRDRGVACSDYFVPVYRHSHIRQSLQADPAQLPVADRVSSRTIALPFFNDLTEKQVLRVRDALKAGIRAGRPVSSAPAAAPGDER